MATIDTGNPHVLGYVRHREGERVLVLANFTEREQRIAANTLRVNGLAYRFGDLITDRRVGIEDDLLLEPYGVRWLAAG